jgi:hypothetical protein
VRHLDRSDDLDRRIIPWIFRSREIIGEEIGWPFRESRLFLMRHRRVHVLQENRDDSMPDEVLSVTAVTNFGKKTVKLSMMLLKYALPVANKQASVFHRLPVSSISTLY